MTGRYWTTLAFVGVVGVLVGMAARTARIKGDGPGLGTTSVERGLDLSIAVDEQSFIEEMISHHRAAVSLTRVALARTTRPELRLLAGNVISRNEHEITEMGSWHREWFADMSGGSRVDAPPETFSTIDVDELNLTPDEDFDATFLSMMLTHYAGVLVKAEEMFLAGPREEIVLFAAHISAEYAAAIGQLQQWRDEWFSLR